MLYPPFLYCIISASFAMQSAAHGQNRLGAAAAIRLQRSFGSLIQRPRLDHIADPDLGKGKPYQSRTSRLWIADERPLIS